MTCTGVVTVAVRVAERARVSPSTNWAPSRLNGDARFTAAFLRRKQRLYLDEWVPPGVQALRGFEPQMLDDLEQGRSR
jgi:hypothetical protein